MSDALQQANRPLDYQYCDMICVMKRTEENVPAMKPNCIEVIRVSCNMASIAKNFTPV